MIWATSIWKLGCSNRSKIRSAQKCYLCLRYVVSPMSPGWTDRKWLRGLDLNQRPPGYEPDELPGCSTPRTHHSGCAGRGQTNDDRLKTCADWHDQMMAT